MSGLDDPFPLGDWAAFRAARDRFFARVRREAADEPPPSACPASPPSEWSDADAPEAPDGDRPAAD